ncbi:BPTD_3080 family restriction endonuclease [Chromatium okenii]|jgi:type III restriction enzyme|uniref:BPTD_3080 family restriction endonuclease n=1 Tax=Chromatium okenii TaxID=61644 RepID=UPI0026F18F68|nr:DEAD/DEAH box helicase family protein [Chromatium okenii]MBV5311137.1 DEAD/DEAH box helicase family protein [Chromatium okenii]
MTASINNPIINSPFEKPERHFLFTEDGITDRIVAGRRKSVYFVPIPKPKVRGKSLSLDLPVENKPEENRLINTLRERVGFWRARGYPAVTATTKRLLEYWQRSDRSRRLFFCQLEALETIIYLTEIAPNKDANQGTSFLNDLNQANADATPAGHPVLPRMACKMATGSGKTVVMAMLIAWQTLNKQANRKDKRFTDAFLVVSPGITIKDRLRTLYPSDSENYYRQLDLVPPSDQDDLGSAKIVITNYHGFMLREDSAGAGLTKRILTGKQAVSPFLETPGQMVQRICGELGKHQIIVLNDEAHHCYHRKPDADDQKLTGDAKREADEREAEARVWINGLEAIARKLGIKAVYDLSATPFFLSGSGYGEGKLFPWVVSDFALIDAIESSIVKVPRVPIEDNTDEPENPLYRNLWRVVGKQLPSGRSVAAAHLPKELQSALHHLYSHYEHTYCNYQQQVAAGFDVMPPVFIVVCSNTRISKLVFDWIAGYEKTVADQTVIVPGNLPTFSNVEQTGQVTQWATRPNTLLIDSQRLESGEALTDEFQQAAATEIEEFKAELRLRFPGRSTEKLTTEDLLREVMNTVGKRGKLGENIKCVVSVSMLTEGWDCRNVTHIMGIRAFGTQLLCEQVIGRGLRRMSYDAEPYCITLANGSTAEFQAFPVEYAEIYGVPFEFLPMAGGGSHPKPNRDTVQVFSVAERQAMQFPRVSGYRYHLPTEQLTATFTASSTLILNTKTVPTIVESAPIIGASSIHCMEDLEARRESEVVFLLAKLVLETYFRQEPTEYAIGGKVENEVKHWLFPQLLTIARRWLNDCVIYQDSTFPQLLLLLDLAHTAAERIYQSIVSGDRQQGGAPTLRPILQPHNTIGDTSGINYLTVRATYKTSAKCPLSHVVADSGWEIQVAQALERMPEVRAYVKNISQLDFRIPYTYEGREHGYWVDFIVGIDDGHGDDLLNLLLEVSGAQRDDKDAKVATVESLWVPAVNNDGRFGRWAFIEINDPREVMKMIRGLLSNQSYIEPKHFESRDAA